MKEEPIVELHAIFTGTVQGVGFRWSVVNHAEEFQINGTIQNLKNGSVEVKAQGLKETLEKFLKSIQENPGQATIKNIKKEFTIPQKKFSSFEILF